MTGFGIVVRKEYKSFLGSEKGIFFVYAVLVILWSFLFLSGDDTYFRSGPVWLIFFSVIISANFANTVFISERMNGALEIFITSGISRDGILFGKMFFTVLMTTIIGFVCAGLAVLWNYLFILDAYDKPALLLSVFDFVVYVAAAFLNAASSAYLSVRLANPRLLHFTNLLLLALIGACFIIFSQFITTPELFLVITLFVIGLLFSFLARREFHSERIIQPVIL